MVLLFVRDAVGLLSPVAWNYWQSCGPWFPVCWLFVLLVSVWPLGSGVGLVPSMQAGACWPLHSGPAGGLGPAWWLYKQACPWPRLQSAHWEDSARDTGRHWRPQAQGQPTLEALTGTGAGGHGSTPAGEQQCSQATQKNWLASLSYFTQGPSLPGEKILSIYNEIVIDGMLGPWGIWHIADADNLGRKNDTKCL